MGQGGNQVRDVHQRLALAAQDHALLPEVVAGQRQDAQAGAQLVFTVHDIEQPRVPDGLNVRGDVTGAATFVGVQGVIKFLLLHHVAGVREGRVAQQGDVAPGMVEVQVRVDDEMNVFRAQA